MDVFLKEDIPERFHYKNNERVTNIMVLAKPGYSVYSVSFRIFQSNAGLFPRLLLAFSMFKML